MRSYGLKIAFLGRLGLAMLILPVYADLAMDVSLGSQMPLEDPGRFDLDFAAHVWYPVDQMVFIGVGSGMQKVGNRQDIPLLASGWIRLPIGRQVLPVVTADWGYTFSDDNFFQWRAGGGLDIKNGDHSSLLVLSGYQSSGGRPNGVYLRGGLLLEF